MIKISLYSAIFIIVAIIAIIAFIFAIWGYVNTKNSASIVSNASVDPGTNAYINGTAIAPTLVFVDVANVTNPTTVTVGPENNGTTFYLANDGPITGSIINFVFSDLSKINDGYYLNIINNSFETHSIGTNVTGSGTSASIPSGGSCKIVKNVTTTKDGSGNTRLITGIVTTLI
jgi:hypothetical protein